MGAFREIRDPSVPHPITPFPTEEIELFTEHFGVMWRDLMERQTNAPTQQERDHAVSVMANLMHEIDLISKQARSGLQDTTRIA